MPDRTEYPAGTFSWADLSTGDSDKAKAFYGEILGWEFEDMPTGDDMGGMVYSMASLNGKTAAALFTGDGSMPPHWNAYATVDDADAAEAKTKELGGTVIMGAFDVLDVGRQLVVQDPGGAYLSLWEPKTHIGASVVNEPGALCWNHLFSSDLDASREFYTGLLGWGWSDDGTFNVDGRMNGSAAPLGPEMQGIPPHWGVFFAVADLEATQAKVGELGGTVVMGPADAGPGRFISVLDPTGAAISFYAGELDD
jgi:predicted enzyme related to lactoylglutathione lyase